MAIDRLQRRQVIALMCGAVAAWPRSARAQARERMRRIGVLMNLGPDDAEGQARLAALLQGLQEAGWAVGRNIGIDLRWGAGDVDSFRKQAAELVALAPDVLFGSGTPAVAPLLQATRTLPVVFAQVVDPVGAGLVASLAHPGGNATGFTASGFEFAGKWAELIKEIAPQVTRVAVLRDPATSSGIGYLGALQSAASSLGMELVPLGVNDAGEIERGITAVARASNGGLIVPGNTLAMVHRELIIGLAARNRLPAVYGLRVFVNDGGLLSFGADTIDPYRRAAGYVDRILRGEKPADLPVQAPTKYELAINLKTAKALGLNLPATLLARADEVIE
jgi:putative tryptophan/tyrosine transport system substrate-binding protein